MLFKEFDELPEQQQFQLLTKWKFHDNSDVLSFQELRRRLICIEWEFTTKFTKANIELEGLEISHYSAWHPYYYYKSRNALNLNYKVFKMIEDCFRIYKDFFLLSSSKGRVGQKSSLSRLPNELFYRVIEMFITK